MPDTPSYDPNAHYKATFNTVIKLEDWSTMLRPGRVYQVRGDLLEQHKDKVATAEKV